MKEKSKNTMLILSFIILLLVGIGCGWYIGVTFANKEVKQNEVKASEDKESINGESRKKYIVGDDDINVSYNDVNVNVKRINNDSLLGYTHVITVNGSKILSDSSWDFIVKSFEFYHNFLIVDFIKSIDSVGDSIAIYDINEKKIDFETDVQKVYKDEELYLYDYKTDDNSIYITYADCGDQCAYESLTNNGDLCSNFEKDKNLIPIEATFKIDYSNGNLSNLDLYETTYFGDLTKEELMNKSRHSYDMLVECYKD